MASPMHRRETYGEIVAGAEELDGAADVELGAVELEVDDGTTADAIVREGWLPGMTSSYTEAVQAPPHIV
jgi:hypothetical protein